DNHGFAHKKEVYTHFENPFRMGTYRRIVTHNPELNKKVVMHPSSAEWVPNIPQSGQYAVYVSYASLPVSARDASYTVHHKGGREVFRVNQQMGGGTWIYLGTFTFDKGRNLSGRVTLTNQSGEVNAIITADAVRFGGGMGNIGRFIQDTAILATYGNIEIPPQVSNYPRFTEGARYWLQWAGFADSVYTYYEGEHDYIDDYSSRGRWVNTLAGGSEKHPDNPGLNIPVDLSLAFHTDAGVTRNDSIIGTLAIYTRDSDGTELLPTGHSRLTSRDYTDLVQTQIVNDLRALWNPNWTRRGIWNRSYSESRSAQVPAMLLELLSHQNFADMRYGLDPTFRFLVSRSIYKGMLKFIATQYNRPFVVQPLPVKDFSATFLSETEVELKWKPTIDESETTAFPTKYIVYTRVNGGGFDNGILVSNNNYKTKIIKDQIYSFKVVAVNDGGISFPSEILSVYRKSEQRGEVLIVNGFTRVSAPSSFTTSNDSIAGFAGRFDNGVPYIADYHFTGLMHEFRRVIPWMDDDSSGFGDSDANYETSKIAGNTFDYPYLHGTAFAEAGYSFASSSASAVESGAVKLTDYETVDWI
ncbi:MAG TPA: xanthan lyase, partial [Rikenellaceae bacterium]|nr:xanthan lyase [Rikenellaceae bacterium]